MSILNIPSFLVFSSLYWIYILQTKDCSLPPATLLLLHQNRNTLFLNEKTRDSYSSGKSKQLKYKARKVPYIIRSYSAHLFWQWAPYNKYVLNNRKIFKDEQG